MQQRLPESAAWWFLSRLRVVDSANAALIVAAICVLSVADDDAGVQEGAPNSPQYCRHLPWR